MSDIKLNTIRIIEPADKWQRGTRMWMDDVEITGLQRWSYSGSINTVKTITIELMVDELTVELEKKRGT